MPRVTPDDLRESVWRMNHERLAQPAWRGMHVKNLKPAEFFVICIDVDDPNWSDLVDILMPGHDWQWYRDQGQAPFARGSVMRDTVGEYLAKTVPVLADALREPDTDEQKIQVVVLAAGGASLYVIEPQMDTVS